MERSAGWDGEATVGWERVIASSEVGHRLRPVGVAGKALLVGRLLGGDVIACSRTCPHRGRDLDDGPLFSDYLACPHHNYTFDARTGENRYPKSVFPRVKASTIEGISIYPARESEGWVWIDVGEPGEAESLP